MRRRIPWHPTEISFMRWENIEKGTCKICGKSDIYISKTLGLCLSCIRKKPEESLEISRYVHEKIRKRFNLPPEPPRNGIECRVCSNNCKIGKGETGYCGLKRNINGKLDIIEGSLDMYYDPLPTNCCASWFCPGSKERGYNLAVFMYGCSFNCLFCQNWEHKFIKRNTVSEPEILEKSRMANCVCYFGGTPEPQLPFLIRVSEKIIEENKIRICWEWNGTGNRNFVKRAAELSYESGGIIKFDIKAFDKNLHLVLTGRPNDATLDNFRYVAENFDRENLLTATTPIIPGYIDTKEIEKIAKFISSLDPNIPYSLLAFHPDFEMLDIPPTPRKLAEECYRIAKKHLKKVNIGNKFILW